MNHLHSPRRPDGTFENPLLFGNFPDPSVLRDGEDYYLTNSSVGFRTMLLWHSRDLVSWKPLYYLLEGAFEDPELASQLSVWAPELVKHGDMFYLYNFSPKYGLWVMTCADIRAGNWTKPRMIKGLEGIDPGHVTDEAGNRFMIVSQNILYPLSPDGLSVTGPGKKICDDWPMPDSWDIEGICPEAPKFTKRNGYYYLTVGQGGTVGPSTSHAVLSFRAKNLEGPYEASPYNPIVRTADRSERWWSKGHGTLVDTPQGNWYILYLAILNGRRDLGRLTLMSPVEWTDDLWFRVPETATADAILPLPSGEDVHPDVSVDEVIRNGSLGILWNAASSADFARVTERDGGIAMQATGTRPFDGTNLWFAAQHLSYEFSVKATILDPDTGFAIGFHFGSFLNAGILFKNGAVRVYHLDHEYLARVTSRPIQGDSVWLKLRNSNGTVSPWYSLDGRTWHKINSCFEINDWSSNTGSGFGYAKPCLAAFGKGTTRFSDFVYTPL